MKAVSVSARRKGLSAVILEDGSELLLDSETVLSEGIVPGSEIADAQALLLQSDIKRAKSRALWYLSRADHSERALADKLKRGGFREEAAEAAVERMRELGLVNDRAYAQRLAAYYASSGVSKREMLFKLRSKGIPGELAGEIVRTDESDEQEKIRRLIGRKYAERLQSEDGVQKVVAALQRKGFSFSDIKSVLKSYSEELNDSEDSYGI